LRDGAFARAEPVPRRAAGRDDRAALRDALLRAGFEALRTAFLLIFRAAFRVRAAALRFAITGFLSALRGASTRPEVP
jgi:hypothetical protein